MEINQLKYFKAVAETGKVSLAAEMMYVTPPAISTSLTGLEKELGMPLFIRRGNGLELNRQGEIFLGYVNSMLLTLLEAKTELEESLANGANQLAVGTTAPNLFVDLITSYSEAYPQIPFSTMTVNLKYDHPSGLYRKSSFLLAAEGELPDDYIALTESIYLFEDSPALMVSKDHPFAQKSMVEPEELLKERIILSRANVNIQDRLLQFFKEKGIKAPVFFIHHQVTCQSLVSRNVGVVLTSTRSQNHISREFVFVPFNAPSCRWSYRLYYKKNREMTPEDLSFLSFVKQYYDL